LTGVQAGAVPAVQAGATAAQTVKDTPPLVATAACAAVVVPKTVFEAVNVLSVPAALHVPVVEAVAAGVAEA
jgi:hypothetical protein